VPAIPIKQGATLSIGAVLQLDDGTPVDLSAATIAAELVDPYGATQGTFTVGLAAATGAFLLSMTSEQTQALPTGLLQSDVLINLPAGAFYSETFPLRVQAAITGGT
jgi:hypothetical protein